MDKLSELQEVYRLAQNINTRRFGKTYTIESIIREKRAKFIASNNTHANYIKNEYAVDPILIEQVERLRGIWNTPVMFDPDAIVKKLGEAIVLILEYEKELEKVNNKLKEIERIVEKV